MKIFELAIELFVLYLLYKLIFDFIIPVINTTKQVKKQFVDMNAQMQEKMKQQQQTPPHNTTPKQAASPGKNDDYIEFEEVPPASKEKR